MIRPKNETEELLLSITKNFQMLIEQTHTKPKETLDLKWSNRGKHSISIHPFKLTEIGC